MSARFRDCPLVFEGVRSCAVWLRGVSFNNFSAKWSGACALCAIPTFPSAAGDFPHVVSLVGGSALGVLACHMLTLSPLTVNSHFLPVDQ